MNESRIGLIRALENTGRTAGPGPDFLTAEATAAAHRIHRELPGYAPTPLVGLDALAKRLGVRGFYVKDESKRFGLNAFLAALLYALFAGLGFTLAMVLMGGVREKLEKLPVAKCMRGFPITMVAAAFMAMAFYVFALL